MVSLATDKDQGRLDQKWNSDNSNDGLKLKEIIAASGISVRLWRLYAYFWLVCLVFPIFSLVQTPPRGISLLFPVLGLVLFAATYFWVTWPHPLNHRARTRFGPWTSIAIITGLTILVLVFSTIYGSAFLWLLIGVSAIAGISLSFRNASVAVFGLTLLTLGISVAESPNLANANWLQIIPLVLLVRGLGLDMIGFVRLSDALRELQAAREQLAFQAVTEERLRMARDLHDLLGHTLSLITLKSELAGRLLEKDPHMATKEIHEVERVARQALRDVREAVAGYRKHSLRGELDGARQILDAAGIECTIEYEAQSLPQNIDAVLGWVVREGVTNVIRHSRAKHCLIRIISTDDTVRAEISNDGDPRKESSIVERGSGLSGLAERVSNAGGQLEATTQSLPNGLGFRLQVEIPIRSGSTMEAR
ncbi:MAG TPA: sensor histidine kinase [Anaerolineales bacterium]|nr:sensor histidine kinase [Anaerolineales bacterium]